MLKRNRLVRSITGFGNVVALSVVSRNHGLLELVKLQFTKRTRDEVFPLVGKISVKDEKSGEILMLVLVLPDVRGLRNKTVPLDVPLTKLSKSEIDCTKSGAVAPFVRVSSVPSITVRLAIAGKTGGRPGVFAFAVVE